MKPIAIIGMASILPKAENLSRFWENILDELNCIEEVPESRWSVEDYYDANPNAPDKTYCKVGGFIPDTVFDPMEFGLPPNILEVTDVSQLLSLNVAKEALQDAGYGQGGEEIREQTGVILGMVGMSAKLIQPLLNRLQYPVWEKVLRASSIPEEFITQIIEKMKLAYIGWNENAFPGALSNVVAGRIANRLDLGGTNCVVDAACGSSLAAVSMAVNELELGYADMMITGGVDTDNSILTYLCFSKTPAFSRGDKLRAFSEDSDGMLVGEGIAMLVLRRLEDAERDNNRIYAVIRGVGSSSDGHFKSIYAPRASGQAKALRRAYERAGYPPSSVDLIEAHGTGTMAGDPAEFEGLREVFNGNTPKKQHIALGSIKSQIGHTKATAGAASMIKAALALHHRVLPATINVTQPNADLQIEETPFYVNSETRPWFKQSMGEPRRAGVSSLGFGGTNFHITLEEYRNGNREFKRVHLAPYDIILHAAAPQMLIQRCREVLDLLQNTDDDAALADLEQESLRTDLPKGHARVGFIAISVGDARDKLNDCLKTFTEKAEETVWEHPKGIYYRSAGMDVKGKTVALFPGQGSQYVNMGKELAIHHPAFREVFETADAVMAGEDRQKFTDVVFPIPAFSDEDRKRQQETLTRTENAQLAIGTMSMALYKLLKGAGLQVDYFAGHSFGELTALWASGVLDDEAFLRLAKARGEAMSPPASTDQDAGGMIAVKGEINKVHKLLETEQEISIANFNSPSQVVLAGASDVVRSIQPKLEALSLVVYPLPVSAAFHTSLVGHAHSPFKNAIQKEKFHPQHGVIFSNTTGQKYPSEISAIKAILAEHILSPVRFKEEIENIYENGGSIFIEIGPKNILTNLVKEILKDKPFETITLNPNPKTSSDRQYRQAVIQMRVLGFELGITDPYKKYEKVEKHEPSKVAVVLNGGLYITEKTKDAFEKALETPAAYPFKYKTPDVTHQELPSSMLGEIQVCEKEEGAAEPTATLSAPGEQPIQALQDPHSVHSWMEQFQQHQQGVLQSHQQFLQNDQASGKIIREIVQTHLSAIEKLKGSPPGAGAERLLSHLEKSAEMVNNQQAGISQAHLAYIQSQTEFSRLYGQLIQEMMHPDGVQPLRIDDRTDLHQFTPQPLNSPQQKVTAALELNTAPAQVNEMPTTAERITLDESTNLKEAFLQIVGEKTGYPSEMLEWSMDMEADLGIDSIKRVEILSAMQEQFPHLPTIEAEDLAALRTLQEIVHAFVQPSAGIVLQTRYPLPTDPVSITHTAEDDRQKSIEEIQECFLRVISEKTGYPIDMLELGMDMEADLGIDSIKRVEILSTMQEQYPSLPIIEAEDLAALRTLEQIVQVFYSNISSGVQPTTPFEEVPLSQTEKETPVEKSFDTADDIIRQAFMRVVSEKTGYPTDMLEMGMDMEADLGIDSIKRVEILSALQEQFPQLPVIEAEDLAVLRTLEEIVAKYSHFPAPNLMKDPPAQQDNAAADRGGSPPLKLHPVGVSPLANADYLEFTIPEDALILITDDGSEKTRALAESFIQRGQKVGLVHFSFLEKSSADGRLGGVQHFDIALLDEAEIQARMQEIVNKNKKIAAFIHLQPSRTSDEKEILDISGNGISIVKAVFLMARHLRKPLSAAGENCRPAFLTISFMDGQFGLNDEGSHDPSAGGLSGLTKSLRMEWNDVFCRALDFHPQMDAHGFAQLVHNELHDPDVGVGEVGYTSDGRFTLLLQED